MLDPTHITLSSNYSLIPGTWGRRSCRMKLFGELWLVLLVIIHSVTLCDIPYLLELSMAFTTLGVNELCASLRTAQRNKPHKQTQKPLS